MWLTTISMPPGYRPETERFIADDWGHIKVKSKSRWETMLFFIHGTRFYDWFWCIEAERYHYQEGTTALLRQPVVLLPTGQTVTCSRPDLLADEQHVGSD